MKYLFLLILATLLVVIMLLVRLLIKYRRMQASYRMLAMKSQQFSGQEESLCTKNNEIKNNETTSTDNPENASTEKNNTPLPDNNENSPIESDDEQAQLICKLHKLLSEEKLYLRAELRLETLAQRLHTNRSYLSQAINKTGGANFTTLINSYRVREAVDILSDPKKDFLTVDAVAAATGFTNRISFNRAFNQLTGLSPTEFRHRIVNHPTQRNKTLCNQQ